MEHQRYEASILEKKLQPGVDPCQPHRPGSGVALVDPRAETTKSKYER